MEILIIMFIIFIPFLLLMMVFGTHRGRKDKRNTAEIKVIEQMNLYRDMLKDEDISTDEKERIEHKITKLKRTHGHLF